MRGKEGRIIDFLHSILAVAGILWTGKEEGREGSPVPVLSRSEDPDDAR